jgi:hypothetical protein
MQTSAIQPAHNSNNSRGASSKEIARSYRTKGEKTNKQTSSMKHIPEMAMKYQRNPEKLHGDTDRQDFGFLGHTEQKLVNFVSIDSKTIPVRSQ